MQTRRSIKPPPHPFRSVDVACMTLRDFRVDAVFLVPYRAAAAIDVDVHDYGQPTGPIDRGDPASPCAALVVRMICRRDGAPPLTCYLESQVGTWDGGNCAEAVAVVARLRAVAAATPRLPPTGEPTLEVTIDRYTVRQEADGYLHALRDGAPWRDLVGDNLVGALASRVEALRDALRTWAQFQNCVPQCVVDSLHGACGDQEVELLGTMSDAAPIDVDESTPRDGGGAQ